MDKPLWGPEHQDLSPHPLLLSLTEPGHLLEAVVPSSVRKHTGTQFCKQHQGSPDSLKKCCATYRGLRTPVMYNFLSVGCLPPLLDIPSTQLGPLAPPSDPV